MASLWRSLRSLTASPLVPLLRHAGVGSTVLAGPGTCKSPPRFLATSARLGAVVPAGRQGSNLLSAPASSSLLQPASAAILVPQRTYKVKSSLKLRCSGCFFVHRQGRLFVECKLKPRHKQMQVMAARKLFRDDYSKGNVARALYWKHRTERFYNLGKNEFSRYNWLEGKLGHTV